MNIQQDWRTLSVGAELDRVIAELLGWHLEKVEWVAVSSADPGWMWALTAPDGRHSRFGSQRPDDAWRMMPPDVVMPEYSTDLNAAFTLLDEIHIPYAWEMSRQDINRLFVVQIELRWPIGSNKADVFNAFAGPDVVAVERAETPAHAIAKAYLSWKEKTHGRP